MKERRHELRGANYGCRSRQRRREKGSGMSSSVMEWLTIKGRAGKKADM
jgi:hypothetical protein